MTPRALLLALGSLTGVLFGRALDGLGVLPGVQESEAARAVALSPLWTGAGAVACLLLGALVDRVRHRPPAALVLLAGQVLVLAAPELAGRSGQGPHPGGEAPLFVAVAVQLLLSLLTLTTVGLLRQLVPTCPSRVLQRPRAYVVALAWCTPPRAHLRVGGVGGRAPPRLPAPALYPQPS